ncbi:hypothetical protein [Streptomyces sp. CB01373]|uniref:hypothetical protein n=1 Tax=Streptomyces sp. CB01373 TaxID=2020325 RepID=UPI00131E7CB3|nr:hypothetical protein [Streptomyces sp. CB01373]
MTGGRFGKTLSRKLENHRPLQGPVAQRGRTATVSQPHPAAGFPDLRPRPYVERRQVLLDVLGDAGPSIVPVWSTTDLDEGLLWYAALEGTGV